MKMKKALAFTAAILMAVSALCSTSLLISAENKIIENNEVAVSVSQPQNLQFCSLGEDSFKVKWSYEGQANGFSVEMKQDGKYVTVCETENKSARLSGLKSAKVYYLRIRAFVMSGDEKLFGKAAYLHACTKPAQVTVKSFKSDNKKVTVKWKKQRASGYQLQYSLSPDFSTVSSRKIKSADTVSYKTKTLKGNKKYYFRIRAYITLNEKNYYSNWRVFSLKTDKGYKTTSKGFKIEKKGGFTYVDGVLIANKTYSLPQSYNPGGLTSDCSKAFNKMKAAAQKDGVNLFIVSGFRSYDTQKRLYNNYVAKDGKKLADTYSARPGTSEHQTGLAMDLNSLSSSFGETKEGRWLAQNCHKYGFIIRYPKGKQSITGYIYEPWHVRYIGVKKATAIYKSGLCLEEYYAITSRYK